MNKDICENNHEGNPESEAAWQSIKHSAAKRDRQRILTLLAGDTFGMTCDQAEIELNLSHQTCSARFSELKRDGAIVPKGKLKTRSGRCATVWTVKPPDAPAPGEWWMPHSPVLWRQSKLCGTKFHEIRLTNVVMGKFIVFQGIPRPGHVMRTYQCSVDQLRAWGYKKEVK